VALLVAAAGTILVVGTRYGVSGHYRLAAVAVRSGSAEKSFLLSTMAAHRSAGDGGAHMAGSPTAEEASSSGPRRQRVARLPRG